MNTWVVVHHKHSLQLLTVVLIGYWSEFHIYKYNLQLNMYAVGKMYHFPIYLLSWTPLKRRPFKVNQNSLQSVKFHQEGTRIFTDDGVLESFNVYAAGFSLMKVSETLFQCICCTLFTDGRVLKSLFKSLCCRNFTDGSLWVLLWMPML